MRKHRDNNPSAPSQRQLRVGELIRHALSDVLSRGAEFDEVLASHMVTVPEVRMSPDLRLATIYVMPLGGRGQKAVLAALNENRKYLRGEIVKRVSIKFAPDIRFLIDERFDEADRIEKLLRSPEVARDIPRKDKNS